MKLILLMFLMLGLQEGESGQSCCQENPIIQTRTGPVKGFKDSYNGFVYNAFFGIPFAVIPGRFMRSVYPHPTWTDVFNANQFPNDCWQLEVGFPQPPAAKSENCLGINVYVPQCTGCWGGKKLAVMLSIHSHGYERISGSILPADYLLSEAQDVIIVTFNFRVGIWGFLFTGDDAVPRNNGMWDIQWALEWVWDNIEYFGGDRTRITLNGFISGGSFSQHMPLIERNRGRFNRTIVADVGVGPFTHIQTSCRIQQRHIWRGEQIAAAVGCPISDHYDMVDCLRTVANELLLEAQSNFTIVKVRIDHRFAVFPDDELIPDVFHRMYVDKRIQDDLLVLSASSYGPVTCTDSPTPFNSWEEWFLDDYKNVAFGNYEEMFYDVALPAYNHQANDSRCSVDTVRYIRWHDKAFAVPLELSMEYHSKFSKKKIYHTRFRYVPSYTPTSSPHFSPIFKGYYADVANFGYGVVGKFGHLLGVSDAERAFGRRLIRQQFNFARSGDPNVGQPIGPQVPLWRHNNRMTLIATLLPEDNYIERNTVGKATTDIWKKGYKTKRVGKNKCIEP